MSTSNSADPPVSPSGSVRRAMRRHPLFCFFLMAYAFSWITLTPYVLSVWNVLPQFFVFTFFLNPFFGPFLAAFIMTGALEGRPGVRRLLGRFAIWRVSWYWYPIVFLGPPALVLLGIIVLPGAAASFQGVPATFPLVYLVNFVVILFIGGPLGEEPGWRGFALPRLQRSYGPLHGTLLLGFLWACWHLPHFLTPAQGGGPGTSFASFLINFPLFIFTAMGLAVLFTWVFNHTRESILMAILLHGSVDGSSFLLRLFPAPTIALTGSWVLLPLAGAAVLIVVLTRGRLGCQQSAASPADRAPMSDSGLQEAD